MPACWPSRISRKCDATHSIIWSHSRLPLVALFMSTRRTEAEIQNFQASTQLSGNLQRVLVDLIELHLQGKQAHWNVVGTNFRDLHLQLDELVDFAREASDTIAERMRALDVIPDGRSDTVAAATSLPQFPAYEHGTGEVVDLITARIYAAVDTLRTVHDDGRRRRSQHGRHPAPAHRRPGEACLADQVGEPQGLDVRLKWVFPARDSDTRHSRIAQAGVGRGGRWMDLLAVGRRQQPDAGGGFRIGPHLARLFATRSVSGH